MLHLGWLRRQRKLYFCGPFAPLCFRRSHVKILSWVYGFVVLCLFWGFATLWLRSRKKAKNLFWKALPCPGSIDGHLALPSYLRNPWMNWYDVITISCCYDWMIAERQISSHSFTSIPHIQTHKKLCWPDDLEDSSPPSNKLWKHSWSRGICCCCCSWQQRLDLSLAFWDFWRPKGVSQHDGQILEC